MSILSDDFKGIWISPEVVHNKDLDWSEKLFLAGLNYVDDEKEFIYLCDQITFTTVYAKNLIERFKQQELLPKNFQI